MYREIRSFCLLLSKAVAMVYGRHIVVTKLNILHGRLFASSEAVARPLGFEGAGRGPFVAGCEVQCWGTKPPRVAMGRGKRIHWSVC